MRRCAIIFLLCLFAGLDVQAGKEHPAKPGEEVVANELIVHLMPGATAATLLAKYLPGVQIQALAHQGFFRIRVPGGLPGGISSQIAADLQVDFVEPNRVRHSLVAAPNDPNYGSSWWFPAIQALQAWSLLPGQYLTAATAGTGRVKVAVLDTGADCTHPDFINTGGTSTNSALGGQLMFSTSQAVVATTIASPVCPWQDDHGHGTHVTGILAAATSNGIGVSGLGYPVQVMEYKVLNAAGSGFDTDIMNAIESATNAGAQVVSLSLGGAGYSSTLQAAVNYAWQHNTLVVAAAGNDAKNEVFFPASANHAVGVSATDSGNNRASFSNYGDLVQLAAPGVGILSTAPSYSGTSQGWLNYVSLSGTSMATPFVAALAGLVAMTTPNATAQAILQRMEQTASSTTTGGGWGQNFGFGLINASSAVAGTLRAATNGAITGQIVDSSLNFVSGAQITINSQTIPADANGLYRIPTLPAGTYPVTVSATNYATQSLSVTVAPGADTPLTVTMGVTYGKFTGTVTDQGLGVAGAIVHALSGGLINAVAIADQSGQYTLWVPGSGTYDVRASQIGRVTTTLAGLTLSPGGTTSANLTLPRMGTIAGSVRNASQNPVANAQVLVTGGSFSAAATTDVNGNYSMIGIPTGNPYSATATAAGFLASTQNGLAVSADVTTNVNFTLASSTVATPTFLPPAGTYTGTQNVTISTTTSGASIRYTTDGSTPTSSVGTLYNSTPVPVTSSLTLKAIAYMAGMTDSAVGSAAYTIQVATPAFLPPAGTYGSAQSVTISTTTSGASIRYTTDGSTPTSSVGTLYNNTPVAVNSNLTLKAIAYEAGMTDSTVASAAYTITGGGGGPAWYNSSWTNRKAVTIDHTKVLGGSSLTNFAVLLSTTDANLKTVANGGSVGKSDGTDILFTAGDGTTKLDHELERYNAATGEVIAWVRIPSLSNTTDTALYIYYGNAGAANQQNPTGVWDSSYKGIWHLSNGTVLNGSDSTANANNGSVVGAGARAGEIDGAGSFSGSSQYININNFAITDPYNFTLEAWINPTDYGNYNGILGKTNSNLPAPFDLYLSAGTGKPSFYFGDGGSHLGALTGTSAPGAGVWSHIVIVGSGSSANVTLTQYLNGATNGATAFTNFTAADTNNSIKIASRNDVFTMFKGGIDEVRISSAPRTPGWIATEYSNQNSPGTFLAIGVQESSGGSQIVATPTFLPPAGIYTGTQNVVISTTTSGASIRYTTNGSTPTSSVGTLYNNTPVAVNSSLTLKAIAYETGMTDSAVASASYTIQVATPTFTPPAGPYGSAQSVTISTTTSGASIRYTTDGSTPTSSVGALYNNTAVPVTSSLTLKAIAYMAGMTDSAVAAATYTITGPVSVPMSQYNFDRTGANLSEQVLNTSNVNPAQFGKLFSRTVDDSVYGLPLIIPNLTIAGGVHDVLYVATMNNSVYAFDAADPAHTQPYWSVNLGTPGVGSTFIGPVNFGILSTPFIEISTNTMYVVAEVRNGTDVGLYIFALDITTGLSKYNSPRRMSFTFPIEGTTLTNVAGAIQRAGLLVSNGVLYVAVANVVPNDYESQEGFVQSFDAHNLSNQLGTFQSTPSATEGKGGIWEAGRGLPVDASGVYFSVAGGAYSSATSPPNLGSSIVKVSAATLNRQDWFAPQNWQYLFNNNIDPAAGGVTLIPGTSLLFAGGKEGVIYLLNRNNMGHLEGTDGQPVQRFQASYGCAQNTAAPDCGQALGTSYWDRGGSGMLYVWDKTDVLRAYPFNGQTFNTAAPQVGTLAGGMTGGPSLSANGADLSSAIVWAVTTTNTDSNTPSAGTLRAYRADNITQELYNSDVNQGGDSLGTMTKFAPPVVANGKVYVSTQSNSVQVYGLLPASRTTQTITFGPLANQTVGVAPFTISATASSGLPVSFNTLTATVCTVAGNSVTILAVGTCSIQATQTGNATYSAATPVVQSFTVNPVPSTVATPTFLPPAGAYTGTQNVTISTATSGASIRYTTDGSTPTSSVGTLYNNTPVAVSNSLTLKAIAYEAGMTDSAVASAAYTITGGGGGPAWYNSSWTNRKALTIDHTKVSGGSSLANFAVLFSTTDPNLKTVANGGSVGKSDGTDILFTAGDGTTKLDHELERYNAATGEVIAWVRIPSLSNTTDTALYIYYGNAGAANQQNPTGVWDSSYKGIWHLSNGTVLNASDSTANANNGSIIGAGASPGKMGGAGTFSGNRIDVGSSPGLAPATAMTASAWIYMTSAGYGNIISNNDNSSWRFRSNPTSHIEFLDHGGSNVLASAGTFSSNAWVYVVIEGTASGLSIYLNGAADTVNGGSAWTSWLPGDTAIGDLMGGGEGFVGRIDEVRISSTARSAGWIATEYSNQNSPSTFLAIGAQESSGGSQVVATPTFNPPPGTYTGTQNVTVSTTTSGASIRYTIDGSTPTSSVGTPYSGPVSVSSNLTLKAVAYKAGMTDSLVASGNYTIQVATPTFLPPAGAYTGTQNVTISTATSGASIRYTTDGSTPTSSVGTLYNNTPVAVSNSLTLKAIAYEAGMTDSAVASAAYTITGGGGGPAWYNSSWTNRKALTIDHTKVSGGSSLANFAVLFSTTDPNLKTVANGGSVGKSDGTDILFTAGDGTTKLDHELERYNAATGEVIAWVRIPSLSNTTDTALYIYYGNAGAANQQNPTGVWDSSYKGIWHLSNGTVLNASDSTANANNGSIIGAGASPGKMGGAGTFSGNRIDVGSSPGLAPATAMTASAWIYMTGAGYGNIISNNDNSSWRFRSNPTSHIEFLDHGGTNALASAGTFPSNAWVYVVIEGTASGLSIYLNGAADTLNGGSAWTSWLPGDTAIGDLMGGGEGFVGRIDEVRISSTARSAGWIATEYTNQNSPSTFLAIGAQE